MNKSAFFLTVCLGVLFCVPFSWAGPSSLPDQKTVSSALSSLSIPFIENKGQFDDNVAFYAKTIGSTVYVTKKGEMVYGFPDFTLVERVPALTAAPKGLAPSRTKVSSFIGNDPAKWQKSLATYTSISLGEVSPGITVSLNAYGGKIEKIIRISPHISPSITLTMKGASSMGLGHDGELVNYTDKGDIAFSKPIAYQEINGKRIPVPIAYMLLQSSPNYTFALGLYDPSHALTIDPILQSTYLGGKGQDVAKALSIGTEGVYVAGWTGSFDFPGTAGGALPTGGGDTFVALLSSDLKSLTQATYLGGSGSDEWVYALATGTEGVYVAGVTGSIDFPGTAGGAQPAFGGGYNDAFVALLSPDLTTLIQSTYLGGGNFDSASALATGTEGVYVAGVTGSMDFPGTTGGAQPTGDNGNAFIALLAPDLKSLTQATYLGGSGFYGDYAHAIAIGAAGVYVAGGTYSTDFPGTTGGAQPDSAGNGEAFIALLAPDLKSLTQATYLGGSGNDDIAALVYGTEGVYVAGITDSSNFPKTIEGAQQTIESSYDAFVALLSPDLKTLAQATYLGGNDYDIPCALTLETTGVYVTGQTWSSDFPGTSGGAQPSLLGECNAFIALLAPDLKSLTQATYLGGSVWNEAFALAIGTEGVYISGQTTSAKFPGTKGGSQQASGGSDDAFVALLSLDLKAFVVSSLTPHEGTIGTEIIINGKFFGNQKGKVLIGVTAAKIVSWNDSTITCVIKKPLPPIPYDVVVQPKKPKDVAPITLADAFTVMAPEIISVVPPSGPSGEVIEISGKYFGSKKPTVYIGTNKCKVVSLAMDAIRFVVPKNVSSGTYNITVVSKVGSDTLIDGFTIP